MDQVSRALLAVGGGATDYQISRSLRFNSADSTHLTRTPGSATNRRTWTWSGWVKRSGLADAYQAIFEVFNGNNDNQVLNISFQGSSFGGVQDAIAIGAYNFNWLVTTALYRDPSAWYHIVLAVDTTQATANNRIRLYVNGSEVTAFGTRNNPTQNADLAINQSAAHYIGSGNARTYFNGYLTEINFIDGQQLTPSSFGETNAQTGVWQPKAYSGSYGTNGFYLNFSDNSNTTAATLGKDYSGNGNNWTPNNFSVAAGAGNDSLVDTPTPYGVDTGAGGSVRGNYATLNPLNATPSSSISNGNLYQVSSLSGHMNGSPSTIAMSSGKWYAEVVFTRISGSTDAYYAGLADSTWQFERLDPGGWYGRFWNPSTGYAYNGETGQKFTSNAGTSYGATYTQGDVIGIAFDADAGTLTFYKNGVSQGTAFTGITGPKVFAASCYKDASITLAFDINFGQRPFAYTAPSGYKALCTQNLPTPTIGATAATQAGKFFNTILWTGNGTNPRSITGMGFQPDFLWLNRRDVGYGSWLYDVLRGATAALKSESTGTGYTYQQVNSFDADGFTQAGAVDQGNNVSGGQYVVWGWKGGGAGVTNTAGIITSTVSANTTSGCSVVTYTGNSSTATVGHGLGVAPAMIIVKNRSYSPSGWVVYHRALGATKYISLNSANAEGTFNYWNNTAPTSTVFSLYPGPSDDVNNSSYNFVAYCFAEVPGYSRFGSYTGNGSNDGPFVFTGFRPAFVMVKSSSGTAGNWVLYDNKRGAYNLNGQKLAANLAAEENNTSELGDSSIGLDFLANGFKIRNTAGPNHNINGATYIFAAFAESPFKFALAR